MRLVGRWAVSPYAKSIHTTGSISAFVLWAPEKRTQTYIVQAGDGGNLHTCSERSESCMQHLGLEVCNLGVQKGHGEPVNHFVNSRIKAFLFSSLEVGGGHECPTRCFHRCTLMLEDEARPRFSSATAGANYGRSTMPHHTRPLPCTRLRQAGRACTPVTK